MAKLNLPSTSLVSTATATADLQAIRRAQLARLGIDLHQTAAMSASIRFVTQDAAMQRMIQSALMVADTKLPVLITGPSGTGKELVAKVLHSNRDKLKPINCAGLVDTLFESELFGYVPGTFTGGLREGREGIIESAGAGTVFFDEIGELPLSQQAKLLRVLQTNRVRRLGASIDTDVHARFVFATNRNLVVEVNEGRFREDLYFRISTIELHISALSARPLDIPLIIATYCADKGYEIPALQPPSHVYQRGNVRAIQRWLDRIQHLGLDPLDPTDHELLYGHTTKPTNTSDEVVHL